MRDTEDFNLVSHKKNGQANEPSGLARPLAARTQRRTVTVLVLVMVLVVLAESELVLTTA